MAKLLLPPALTKPRPQHSISRVRAFLHCELRYSLEFQEPWRETPATARGNQLHGSLERAALLLRDDGFRARPEDIHTAGPLGQGTASDWLEHALPHLWELQPQRVEEWIRGRLSGCEWPACGKLDLRAVDDEGPILVDWKSVESLGKLVSERDAPHDIQGRFYCWLTGVNRFRWVGFNRHHSRVVTVTHDPDDLEVWGRWFARQCQAIERRWEHGGWRLTDEPGRGLCSKRWCPYWEKCYGAP